MLCYFLNMIFSKQQTLAGFWVAHGAWCVPFGRTGAAFQDAWKTCLEKATGPDDPNGMAAAAAAQRRSGPGTDLVVHSYKYTAWYLGVEYLGQVLVYYKL